MMFDLGKIFAWHAMRQVLKSEKYSVKNVKFGRLTRDDDGNYIAAFTGTGNRIHRGTVEGHIQLLKGGGALVSSNVPFHVLRS